MREGWAAHPCASVGSTGSSHLPGCTPRREDFPSLWPCHSLFCLKSGSNYRNLCCVQQWGNSKPGNGCCVQPLRSPLVQFGCGGFISGVVQSILRRGDTWSREYTGRTLLQSIKHKSQGICSSVNELSQDMVFVFGLKSIAKLPVMLVRGGFSARSISGLWRFAGSTCGVSSACGVLVALVSLSLWMTLGIPWPLKPGRCSVHALSVLKLFSVPVCIEICCLHPLTQLVLSWFSQG